MYNFDKLVDRMGTDCVKWDLSSTLFGSDDVIPLWIADMDFEVLPELQKALHERVDHPSFGYSFPSPAYYGSIIKWCGERHGVDLEKDDILPVAGVVTAVAFALTALTEKGDKVMINTPVYNPFAFTIKALGREVVASSLKCDGTHRVMDFHDMEAKMKQGVKVLILCNPHNPIGRVWNNEELGQLVELCAKYNVTLFSDEIHSDICFADNKHRSILTVSDKAREIAICAMAPSKTFNVAGLKSSFYLIKNPDLRDKISAEMNAFHVGVDLMAYKATEVCYSCGVRWVDELNTYLYENAKFVADFFETQLPEVKAYVPEGTYLMWLDFSAFGLTQKELMDKLKTIAKVGLNDGSVYGEEGVGFVRFNIGSPKFLLEDALKRIKMAFTE